MREFVIANLAEGMLFWISEVSPGAWNWTDEFSGAKRYPYSDAVFVADKLKSAGCLHSQLSIVKADYAERLAAGADYQKPLQLIEARIEEIRSEYINKLNIFDGLKAEWRRAVHQLEYIARKLKEA